ncbi:hypothetical protein RN001_015107 [Aquatica leii]|uniref:Uncharacterized protein n=1 Tax=Aquatica leii TaxID=1421715 RepID=A0AAN7QCB6_9COLE|nr:hypothetical protein RN001_015107 [Aquatica leii]
MAQVPEQSAKAWANFVHRYQSECICATGVNPVAVNKWLFNYEFPEDACLKCFIACIAKRLDLLNPDGSVNYEKNIQMIKYIPGTNAEITNNCTRETINITDICEKSFKYSYCVQTAIIRGAKN